MIPNVIEFYAAQRKRRFRNMISARFWEFPSLIRLFGFGILQYHTPPESFFFPALDLPLPTCSRRA